MMRTAVRTMLLNRDFRLPPITSLWPTRTISGWTFTSSTWKVGRPRYSSRRPGNRC